jgi:hypothetical protein
MTPKESNSLERLVESVDGKSLGGDLSKTEFIQFRVTAKEKADIRRTAKHLHLTVSEYLLRMHTLVTQKLNKE